LTISTNALLAQGGQTAAGIKISVKAGNPGAAACGSARHERSVQGCSQPDPGTLRGNGRGQHITNSNEQPTGPLMEPRCFKTRQER
jgi:hypothetical protein